MKSQQQWSDYMNAKKIKAQQELNKCELALNNETHFYDLYKKSSERNCKNRKKEVIEQPEKEAEYFI